MTDPADVFMILMIPNAPATASSGAPSIGSMDQAQQ
jgi:hypothetical protein